VANTPDLIHRTLMLMEKAESLEIKLWTLRVIRSLSQDEPIQQEIGKLTR
jgi:hypothetical protein